MDEPSALSILPPLLALILAVATRNVIVSLGLGVFLGMTIHNSYNPFFGLLDLVDRGIFVQLAKPSNARVVIIISIIGGFVHLLDRSGGMSAFARRMARVIGSPARAQLSVWLMGMAIFFTDSGNSLILGPMFRPIFAKLRICREKLAFIIDSTSSPVCVLIPIISWGVYIMSLMEQSFSPLGIEETPFSAFVRVLPFQLYPILAILTVPVMALSGREWGPMARAQRRALEANEVDEVETPSTHEGHGSRHAVIIPLATLLLVLVGLFGYFLATAGALPGDRIQIALVLAYLSGAAACAVVLAREGARTIKESISTFLEGMGKMVFIIIILLLAWSLGDVCELLGTGPFMATLFGDALGPGWLPALVFILGAVVSLSTGSSWGTFALLMPIAIPVAHEIGSPLYVTIAAVLSGGMFGDHSSPVSDTTILSSMATGCKHVDHVNTQLAYAAVAGGVAFCGFVLAGHTGLVYTAFLAAALQVGATLALARLIGTDNQPGPEVES